MKLPSFVVVGLPGMTVERVVNEVGAACTMKKDGFYLTRPRPLTLTFT